MSFYRVIREYRILLPVGLHHDSLLKLQRHMKRHFEQKDPKTDLEMRAAGISRGDHSVYILTIKTRQPTTSFIQGLLASYDGRLEQIDG